MNKTVRLLLCLLGLPMAVHGATHANNDFPTLDRVLYVQECIAAHPDAGHFEMASKCSCAVDTLAREIRYSEYVDLSTAAKATTIGGERGGYIRDSEKLQADIKRYKALQAKANKGCFIGPPTAR
ncbi:MULTISPECIES: hypothetical protein [unclassified Variovorax]|uniref:hypothetical protein n=1 Tax=unclassified Variovorax TaxID=663243 RepID=UPI0034E94119